MGRNPSASIRDRTVRDFGNQWTKYTTNEGYYASTELLWDILSPLLTREDVSEKQVMDIGSGTGRIVAMLLASGASHVHAVEPSDAFTVLRDNVSEFADHVTLHHAVGEDIPTDLGLDLVCSIGVIHHISDPDPTVRAVYHTLRPGGKALFWLYGREGNRLYLVAVLPLRALTKRLPDPLLHALTWILEPAASLYAAACKHLPLPMRTYKRSFFSKLSRPQRRLHIYDQLNPAHADYYTKDQALALMERNGFTDVRAHHRHGYSWSVVGSKPNES